MRIRDHRLQLLDLGPGEGGRHHDVDAVWLAVHVLVDPGQLDLQLLGGECQRAQALPFRLSG